MPTTANKGYSVQTTGSNSGTWGDNLNDDMIAIVDNNMGGIVTKSVSSSNIVLSATESQMVVVRLTGSILANIQVTTSCVGFFFVENLTTGSFDITVTNGVAGVVVPKGRSTVIADTTNGCRIAGTDSFPPGTRIVFQQTFAPTGWTKEVGSTYADNALRINIGAVTQGGTANFSTVFQARTIARANLPNFSLPVSDPGHLHVTHINGGTAEGSGGRPVVGGGASFGLDYTTSANVTNISVNSGGSGTPMDFAVKYTDVTIAQKD